MKKLFISLLTISLCLVQSLPVYAQEEQIEDEPIVEETINDEETEIDESMDEDIIEEPEQEVTSTIDYGEEEITDIDGFEDDLFSQYVESVMYPSISLFSIVDDILVEQGPKSTLYQTWKTSVTSVANGELSNTQIVVYNSETPLYIPVTDINMNRYTKSGTQYAITSCLVYELLGYLQVDCPYELYWFDKVSGASISRVIDQQVIDGVEYFMLYKLTIKMRVNKEYSVSQTTGTYVADTTKTGATLNAVETAYSVVEAAEDLADIEKLRYYRDYICDAVSYNYDAANAQSLYGDPWQIIYVFDEDEDTNIVCEGYAKAFEYLCNLSAFDEDISCITTWGTTSGAHMWNIITMEDGQNYIVDLTNYDAINPLYRDSFFIASATGSLTSGYTVTYNRGLSRVVYKYDNAVLNYYGSYLYISSTPYGQTTEIVEPTTLTLSSSELTLQVGLKSVTLQATVDEGSDDRLSFTSSNDKVAKVDQNGNVTPIGAGTCKITVSTYNHISQSCLVTVKDTVGYRITDGILRITGTGNMNDWDFVEDVPWYANREDITSVYIEDGITNIGNNFLASLPNLERIYVPASVTTIQGTLSNDVTYHTTEDSTLDEMLDDSYSVHYVEEHSDIIQGYSLTLDSIIGLNFYLDIDPVATFDDESYICVIYPDDSTETIYTRDLEKTTVDGQTYYKGKTLVCAKEMTQNIYFVYYDQFTNQQYSYSVEDYVNTILDTYEQEDFTYQVAKALLTYGYYAQVYFDYNTTSLPGNIETLPDYELSPCIEQNESDGIEFIGARLVCKETMNLKLYFIGEVQLYVNGNEAQVESESCYRVVTIPLSSTNQTVLVTAENYSLSYNLSSYAYAASNTENEDLINLTLAILNYYSYFDLE